MYAYLQRVHLLYLSVVHSFILLGAVVEERIGVICRSSCLWTPQGLNAVLAILPCLKNFDMKRQYTVSVTPSLLCHWQVLDMPCQTERQCRSSSISDGCPAT